MSLIKNPCIADISVSISGNYIIGKSHSFGFFEIAVDEPYGMAYNK